MHIAVGTQNPAKLKAVSDALAQYQTYTNSTITGYTISSGVPDQPVGLDQIVAGAKQRATEAYNHGDAQLGIGLESGIFLVPSTKSEYMDTVCCALYDGTQYHLGLSSSFEYPKALVEKVLNEGKEVSLAATELGFGTNKQGGGMIGFLTNGILDRSGYTEQAIHTAMVHLNHPELY